VSHVINDQVAERLEEVARLLDGQGANPFRARAYRTAAASVRALGEPISELLTREGYEGLDALPGVGESIARAIRDLLVHGRLPMLERLRGESDPIRLLSTIPGIGPKLAARLHHELALDSLEDLETAAHDGRLAGLPGIGERRLEGIRDSLAQRLTRLRSAVPRPAAALPPVSELLDVDREYREQAEAGALRTIAPRRLNPGGEAWLPVMHARRGRRQYTALYSNTPRAHQLGKTRDWVVLYYDGGDGERTTTVITAERGPLRGRRIVRGREAECAIFYARTAPGDGTPARKSKSAARGRADHAAGGQAARP
jgi:hypothetical protein